MKLASIILSGLFQLTAGQSLAASLAPLAFPSITDAVPNTYVSSAVIMVSGLTGSGPTQISIRGGEYRINWAPPTNQPGVVRNGDQVLVRLRSADAFSASRTVHLTIGGTTSTFTVVTMPQYRGTGDASFFHSEPGDSIGQGESWLMDTTHGYNFSSHTACCSSGSVTIWAIQGSYANWWWLDLSPAAGRLKPGKYLNAQRFPFQAPGHPGLNVSGNGRGCNTLTGEFEVLDVAYDASGTVSKLAVNFEQHCEGARSDLYGQLRYRSTIPLDIIVRGKRHDYLADGTADILWRNPVTGENVVWSSANSTTPRAVAPMGAAWKVAGISDFSGNGWADVLWRNTATGSNVIWKSANSAEPQAVAPLPIEWSVSFAGDFDGNGKSDILWRNPTNGNNQIWFSGNSATQRTSSVPVAWVVAGVGDFNGDGKSDILWRVPTTGSNVIWLSGNLAQSINRALPALTAAGVGDFNGDGASDILWRNQTTGTNLIWLSGDSVRQQAVSANSTAWSVAMVGDFDGDNKDDIVWRNVTTGANVIWPAANASAARSLTAKGSPWMMAN